MVARSLLRIAIPMMVSQYSLIIIQIVDAWMLGKLGSNELAAIASGGMLILMIENFGIGFFGMWITLVSQAQGNRDADQCVIHAWKALYLSVVLGISIQTFWPFIPRVCDLLGHDLAVRNLEITYFRVSLLAMLPQYVSLAIMSYLIGRQKTRAAMVGSLIGMVTNALYNYALIFGHFGCPEMGFVGAAWGTVMASFMQALFLWFIFFRDVGGSGLARFVPTELWRLTKLASVPGLHCCIDVLSWGVILMYLIGTISVPDLAAATILVRCMQLCFLPCEGIAAAVQTLVGESIGKRDYDAARNQASVACKMMLIYMVTTGFVLYVMRDGIVQLFTSDPEVIAISVSCMVFVSFFQFFDALNLTYLNALHGAGDMTWPNAVNALLCVFILIFGGLAMLHFAPHLRSLGVWLVASAYIFAQGISFLLRWRSNAWMPHERGKT